MQENRSTGFSFFLFTLISRSSCRGIMVSSIHLFSAPILFLPPSRASFFAPFSLGQELSPRSLPLNLIEFPTGTMPLSPSLFLSLYPTPFALFSLEAVAIVINVVIDPWDAKRREFDECFTNLHRPFRNITALIRGLEVKYAFLSSCSLYTLLALLFYVGAVK